MDKVLSNTRNVSQNPIPSKVGVGPKSAFCSLKIFGRGAKRIYTAAKDLFTIIIHYKVSLKMTLLTVVCRMSSLNQVEMFGSGQSIPDDLCLSTNKGANERKCVTDQKTNTDKFVSTPIPGFSCQEHLDLSRLSSTKADTSEIGPQAFLVVIKDVAYITSIDTFCHQLKFQHIVIRLSVWFCSVLESEQNPAVPVRPRYDQFPAKRTLVSISIVHQSFTKADSSELSLQAYTIATQCSATIYGFSQWRFDNHLAIQIVGLVYCSALVWSEQNVVVHARHDHHQVEPVLHQHPLGLHQGQEGRAQHEDGRHQRCRCRHHLQGQEA